MFLTWLAVWCNILYNHAKNYHDILVNMFNRRCFRDTHLLYADDFCKLFSFLYHACMFNTSSFDFRQIWSNVSIWPNNHPSSVWFPWAGIIPIASWSITLARNTRFHGDGTVIQFSHNIFPYPHFLMIPVKIKFSKFKTASFMCIQTSSTIL